eukprot:gene14173-16709_t
MPLYSNQQRCTTKVNVLLGGVDQQVGIQFTTNVTTTQISSVSTDIKYPDTLLMSFMLTFDSTVTAIDLTASINASTTSTKTIAGLKCLDYLPFIIYNVTRPQQALTYFFFTFLTNTTGDQPLDSELGCYYPMISSFSYPTYSFHSVRLIPYIRDGCDYNRANISITPKLGTSHYTQYIVLESLYPLPSNASLDQSKSLFAPNQGPMLESMTTTNIQFSLNALFSFTNTMNTIVCAWIDYPLCVFGSFPVLGNNSHATYWFGDTMNKNTNNYKLFVGGQTQSSSIDCSFSWAVNDTNQDPPVMLTPLSLGNIGSIAMFEVQSQDFLYDKDLQIVVIFKGSTGEDDAKSPMPFPFGFGPGNMMSFSYLATQFISTYADSIDYSLTYDNLNGEQLKVTPPGTDKTDPWVVSMTTTRLGAYGNILRVITHDESSGVYQVLVNFGSPLEYIGSYATTDQDIVHIDNSLTPPMITYEILFELQNEIKSIAVKDLARNEVKYIKGTPLTTSLGIPTISYNVEWTANDITHIEFASNSVDVTNKPAINTLYFNVTNADIMYKPKISIPQIFNSDGTNETFTGAWDNVRKLYKVDFKLLKNIFEGPLMYTILAKQIDLGNLATYNILSSELISIFGQSAVLNIISNNADQLPPIIVEVVTIPQTGVLTIDPLLDNSIGWDLTVEDLVNGFAWGYVEVTSNMDPIPMIFQLNNTTRQSGDIYRGVYSITVPLYKQTITQVFSISAYLVDTAGHTSQKLETKSLDPLVGVPPGTQLNIRVINDVQVPGDDNDPPVITLLQLDQVTIDVGSQDRKVFVRLEIEDMGVGVQEDNNPTVFFTSLYGSVYACPTVLDYCNSTTNCQYLCKGELPYGFGSKDAKIWLSVYGIFDRNLNMNGYSSYALAKLSFSPNTTIAREFNPVPFIKSVSPLPLEGGMLTVYGYQFGLDRNQAKFTLVDSSGLITAINASSFDIYTGILCTFYVPPFATSDTSYSITGVINTIPTNSVVLNPSAVVDPNFAFLVDTSPDSKTDIVICQRHSNGLSGAQLAGIIIGSVCAVIVAAIVGIYYHHKSRKEKQENIKMQQKLAKMSEI